MCGRNVMKNNFKKTLPETLAPTERQTIRGPERELLYSAGQTHRCRKLDEGKGNSVSSVASAEKDLVQYSTCVSVCMCVWVEFEKGRFMIYL